MNDGIILVESHIDMAKLAEMARAFNGEMVKAVVDVQRKIMAVGGQMHADSEAVLLEAGSTQEDLWEINIYPDEKMPEMIEFDSMINVRPGQNNRSRGVDSQELRKIIVAIVSKLIT